MLCLCLLLTCPAWAGQPIDITNYYLDPHPERLTNFLWESSLRPDLRDEALDIHAVFIAAALNKAPQYTQATLDQAALLTAERSELALKTAWLMNNKAGNAFLAKAAKDSWPDAADMLATPAPDFRSLEAMDDFTLDCLWVTFFATGDEWPVLQILSVAALKPTSAETDILRSAAAWSLQSNARQHARVKSILADARTASPQNAQLIDAILE